MASIFSSLFGVGTQPQQQPQAAAVTTQELPKQVAPYYEKLLKEAEALYKQKMEAGAPIYEGKTIAGFTPEQEQLFTGLQSLQGTQAPKFAEAEALTRGTAAKITPEEVQEYMNPYQQAVVDIEKREAQKQYESTVVPQLAAQAAATGGFGGSRQAILEGMASEAQQRLLGDIQAKGSAQAYQDAMSNISAQRQREGAAAGQLAQMAPAGFQAQAQELGAIGKVGDVKQQQAQLALDEAYKQFLQEQQFPSEALKEYQSYVQSFPNIPTQVTRTPPQQGPGLAQSLLGLGTTALGTYGAFGGFSPGGFMGMKQAETGGGIAALPVVRAQGGKRIGQRISDFFASQAEKLGVPGYVEEEEETPLGTGLKGLQTFGEGTKGAIETITSPIDFITGGLTGKKPQVFGKELPTASDLLQLGGERLIETKGDRTKRLEDEAFDREYKKDSINKALREANKGKAPQIDPITDKQAEDARIRIDQDVIKLGIQDALEREAALQKQLEQVQKNTPEEAAIKSQIAQLKEAYSKIGEYKEPDTSGVTSAMKDARKVKQDVISRLGAEAKEIDEQRTRDISAGAIEAGRAIMSAPNLFSAINEGLATFGREGKKSMDTAKAKKKANKEKAEAITLEIANDKVAEQQFILSMKTDAEAKKAQRIIDKIKAGATISTAEANFMNAKSNRIKADADKLVAEGKSIPKTVDFSTADLNKNIDIAKQFKDDIAKSINVEGMDEADKLKTVGRLSRNKKFMMQVSQAYEDYKAAKPRGGMGPNQFISTYIKQIVEQDPTSREKDYIPNFGLFG